MSDESKIDDGGHSLGQARPRWVGKLDPTLMASDLTMRDWFAGMALQGLCASDRFVRNADSDSWQAEWAYSLADAMLAERRKVKP